MTRLTLTEEQRQKLVDRLLALDARQGCPRCQHMKFLVLDGLAQIPTYGLDAEMKTVLAGGAVPAVMTACMSCGAINFHALRVLDPSLDVKPRAG